MTKGEREKPCALSVSLVQQKKATSQALYPQGEPGRVTLSEQMRVEALRSAGGAKPRNEVTKGSSKDYSQPILLLLFATEERDPSTSLRMTKMPCFKLLTMVKQSPSLAHSPSPDCVGSSLPEGAFRRDPSTPLLSAQDDRSRAFL